MVARMTMVTKDNDDKEDDSCMITTTISTTRTRATTQKIQPYNVIAMMTARPQQLQQQ